MVRARPGVKDLDPSAITDAPFHFPLVAQTKKEWNNGNKITVLHILVYRKRLWIYSELDLR
jgi:hypothetical protein